MVPTAPSPSLLPEPRARLRRSLHPHHAYSFYSMVPWFISEMHSSDSI